MPPRASGAGVLPPAVALVVPCAENERPLVAGLLADLRAQRALAEVLVVDAGATPWSAPAGARVVREIVPGRAAALRRARALVSAPWVACCDPAARHDPRWLERLLARAERSSLDLVTCDVAASGAPRAEDALAPGEAPGWEAGALWRRTALDALAPWDFAPVELALARAARARGAQGHVPEALVALAPEALARRHERARADAALLALEGADEVDTPELTVLLATHERRDVLVECLEAFARQPLARGRFEIVVVDDGSTDGTDALAGALRLRVPFAYLRVEAGGAARARNAVLPRARGRLVLFVNDDTIPFPDTLQRHLEAHRELEGRRAIVLGTFEQPPEHTGMALTRLLERTSYVFDYARWSAGQVLPGQAFYTCNLSLPLAAVREAGGFDGSFAMYAEDTELGVRLERAGWRIHYRPECRSIHRHLLGFDLMRWRQEAVARAHVRLFRKHPELLVGSAWAGWTRFQLERQGERLEPFRGAFERAARTLAGVRCDALERAGGDDALAGADVEARLAELFGKLNRLWWERGFAEGLREQGLSGFQELFADWTPPAPAPDAPLVLLRATRAEPERWLMRLEAWLDRRAAAAGAGSANGALLSPPPASPDARDAEALVLLVDPAELDAGTVERLAAPVVLRALRNGPLAPCALLVGDDAAQAAAFARARAWIPSGGAEDAADAERARRAGLERLALDPHDPGAWRWPLASAAPWRLLAWPDWSSARSLGALASAMRAVPAEARVCFVLRHDAAHDPDPRPALRGLRGALGPRAAGSEPFDLLLERSALGAEEWVALGRSVDAALQLPSEEGSPTRLIGRLSTPQLFSAQDVAAYLAGAPARERLRLPRLAPGGPLHA